MKASEYFGDWMDVIDTAELRKILSWISTIDKTTLCPSSPNIFKAFRACPLKDCKVVFLGQDPYPQQGVATGILFGNSKDTPEDKLSPSLQIVKEAAINYEIPHNRIEFDNTLESWATQGILMINTFPALLLIGIILFAVTTLFSIVTLPVEYDASNRALAWLKNKNMVSQQEYAGAEDSLKWAARTYLVAAIGSIATLLYYVMRYVGASRD